MGAWGFGMQECDDFLDFLADYNESPTKMIKKLLKEIDNFINEPDSHQGLLGIIDFIIDAGKRKQILSLIPKIEIIIDRELQKLNDWAEPEKRKEALEIFRKKLNGKKPQKIKNQSLLDVVIENIRNIRNQS
jgi:hypothetical protein